MAKPKDAESPFAGIIAARKLVSPVTESIQGTQNTGRPEKLIKSRHPDYTRLTFYLRKEIDSKVRQKVAGLPKEQRELSDALERLVEAWVEGRVEI